MIHPRSRRPRRTPPRIRTRPRWGLRIATGFTGLVLVAGGIGHALLTGLESGIDRVDAFRGLDDRPKHGGGGMNILLVGTDGRDKVSAEEKARYRLGGAPCHCTDTVMLVHLSADRDRASVVSLPRDTLAEVPAYTDPATGKRRAAHAQKLNAAYAEGGPSLTVRTVEHMTGVHLDHYLEVDFTSFMRTVDVVGGVEVCTEKPLKDSYTGLDMPVGKHRLGGGQALQYVRSRHIDGDADLGRMQRQQRFMAAIIHKATDSGVLLNPVRFNKVVSTLLGSVRADRGFDVGDMMTLARAMRGFSPSSSEFASVPISEPGHAAPGLGSTVEWDRPKADRLFRALRLDQPLADHVTKGPKPTLVDVVPSRIRVQVLNGTTTKGLGRRVDGALRKAGYATTGAPADAVEDGVRRTLVEYDPGWDRSARSLAAGLPGARLRAVAGLGPTLRVTAGSDFTGVRPVRAAGPQGPNKRGFEAVSGDQVSCD